MHACHRSTGHLPIPQRCFISNLQSFSRIAVRNISQSCNGKFISLCESCSGLLLQGMVRDTLTLLMFIHHH
ncbi:hypothetical protein HBI56_107450 [Parastagonospora nodorum]|nr:hypothetical protein HBI10_166290 [Parastagonospora nodorum]KAH4021796.1 hypothetical protein HBI13_107540 [Parastagonospora nodorum]KAH4030544.1 hypothetical protein HBI09_131020 [Parastagonospora nodorum]KAH4208600.1 hypothetical protein HBI95_092870 [Parastagonospora nodorum]KAH4268986.1 hypothetical protein HBI03_051570 [Parastagonospora nodorum]